MSVILTLVVSLGPGPALVTRIDADDVEFEDVVVAALASGFLGLRNHEGRCIPV